MPRVTFRQLDGSDLEVEATTGQSMMEVAVANNVDGIWAQCGGAASCATCHVYVDEAFADKLGEISDNEDDMLDGILGERRDTSRLSCQIKVTDDLDGLTVEVAPED